MKNLFEKPPRNSIKNSEAPTLAATSYVPGARRYLSEQEVADELDLSVKTLQKWRYEGGGPDFAKHGSRVAYDRLDLIAWEASCKRSHTSEGR